GLEGGMDGLGGELAGGGDGQGLHPLEDLAVGGGVGGLLELAGQEQGLLQEQGFQGRGCRKGARGHGGILPKVAPRIPVRRKTTRNYSCTLTLMTRAQPKTPASNFLF